LAAGFSCHILPIPEIIKGFLAMPSFAAIPYLAGRPFLNIKVFKEVLFGMDALSHAFLCWLAGVVLIVSSVISLYSLHIFNLNAYLCVMAGFLSLYYFLFNERRIGNGGFSAPWMPLSILAVFSITLAAYLVHREPFPLWNNHDIFETHNVFSWLIIDYNAILMTPYYIHTLAILTAGLSSSFNVAPYTFAWVSSHILFPFLFAFGLYFFLSAFTGGRWASISILVIMRVLWWAQHIPVWTMSMYTPRVIIYLLVPFMFYFIEKNIIPPLKDINAKKLWMALSSSAGFLVVLFLLMLAIYYYFGPSGFILISLYFISLSLLLAHKKNKREYLYFFLITAPFSAVLLIHNPMGLIICITGMLYIFSAYLSSRHPQKTRIFIGFGIFLLLGLIFLQSKGYIDIQKALLFPSFRDNVKRDIGFYTKVMRFIGFYRLEILYFLILGICSVIIGGLKRLYPLLIVFLFYAASYMFLADSQIERIMMMGHVFAALLLWCGMVMLIGILRKSMGPGGPLRNLLHLFAILLILVVPIRQMLWPSAFWTRDSESQHAASSFISKHEYSMGIWMKSHLRKDTLVVSDPWTSIVTSAISHIRGIPYAARNLNVQDRLFRALSQRTAEDIYKEIQLLVGEKEMIQTYTVYSSSFLRRWRSRQFPIDTAVVIVEPRTNVWLKNKRLREHNIMITRPPTSEESKLYLRKFLDKKYFTLLHNENDEVYLFGVNPKPGASYIVNPNLENEDTSY
jgi:hypothetical protein